MIDAIIPNTVKFTGIQPPGIAQSHIPTTFLWIPNHTCNRFSESHISSTLREVILIAVSDIPYKKHWGTEALIIEGSEYYKHQISATCTSPGNSKYQDAHRSELAGIFHVVSIVGEISLKFK